MEKQKTRAFLLNFPTFVMQNYSKLAQVMITCCLMMFLSWVLTPTAEALTQIRLFDVSYKDCPAELAKGAVTSGGYPKSALTLGTSAKTSSYLSCKPCSVN